MKEGRLKTRPTLLENLVFFVEVRHPIFIVWIRLFECSINTLVTLQTMCVVFWVATYCAKILRPLKASLQKKKKKKKDVSTALVYFQ